MRDDIYAGYTAVRLSDGSLGARCSLRFCGLVSIDLHAVSRHIAQTRAANDTVIGCNSPGHSFIAGNSDCIGAGHHLAFIQRGSIICSPLDIRISAGELSGTADDRPPAACPIRSGIRQYDRVVFAIVWLRPPAIEVFPFSTAFSTMSLLSLAVPISDTPPAKLVK